MSIYKSSSIFCFILIISAGGVSAQTDSYPTVLNRFNQKVHSAFYMPRIGYYKEFSSDTEKNKVSFLWSLCALWQADNEVENAVPDERVMRKDFIVIQKYDNLAMPAEGYDSYAPAFGGGQRYYDDNQWIGLAAMDAYFRTKDKFYLNIGEKIYRFMMTGYDTVSCGGIYWREGDKATKNTCSNGPGILLALKLYKATKKQSFLDTALLLYKWVNAHLQDSSGLYYDNIDMKTGKISKAMFSYNTGTMLESDVYLYELLKDKKYLAEAKRVADKSIAYFYKDGKFRDDYWFNAVLLRAYQRLLEIDSDKRYIDAFKTALNNALQNDMDANGLMGKNKEENLVAQGGMLEILARFAWMQKHHYL